MKYLTGPNHIKINSMRNIRFTFFSILFLISNIYAQSSGLDLNIDTNATFFSKITKKTQYTILIISVFNNDYDIIEFKIFKKQGILACKTTLIYPERDSSKNILNAVIIDSTFYLNDSQIKRLKLLENNIIFGKIRPDFIWTGCSTYYILKTSDGSICKQYLYKGRKYFFPEYYLMIPKNYSITRTKTLKHLSNRKLLKYLTNINKCSQGNK